MSFLQILAPELSDEMLADFLKTESGILVNLHVQAIDQTEAIKTIKRKITDLDAMKIQEQKKAVRSGYDMDILPSDLATYGEDAKKLLNKLQTRNERLFMLTFLVLNVADTKQKLGNDVFQAAGVAQKYNCSLVRLDYQQEQGLVSSLPLGINQIKIQRSLHHLQRGGVCALCHAGAFPERCGHVLRHQRKIPQHDHAGPQAGPVSPTA